MKRACILRDGVKCAAERAEGASVETVGVRGTEDVGARGVDRAVDGEGGGVEESVAAAGEDLARVGYLEEGGDGDVREGDAEGVYPEGGAVEWVLFGLVS